MGEMADYYMDKALDAEWEQHEKDQYYNGIHHSQILSTYLKGELYWNSKDGTTTLIQNLSDNHLINLIAYIDRAKSSTVAYEIKDVLEIEKYNRSRK